MFDAPDYPYKDFTESLTDHYDPDPGLLFTNATTTNAVSSCNKSLADVTEDIILNVGNPLTCQSNDSGQYFNLENTSLYDLNTSNMEQSTELLIVQSETLHNYEPTLLDENTVNQFLLPLKVSSDGNKDTEDNGPDLLSLQSCVVCHEIFTTETDLLEHTMSVHASNAFVDPNENGAVCENNRVAIAEENISNSASSSLDFECEWLVCSICHRVLSTALEIEPNEPLCCDNGIGKGSTTPRKLHSMYVCDLCSGLFADGEALDIHRIACYNLNQQNYYSGQPINSTETSWNQGPEVCFSCDVCERQFPSADELKTHALKCQRPVPKTERRVYTGGSSNKMWNCGSCNQLFATARELYRHKRGEDRPPGAPLMAYVCEECDKVLGSMCALHTHKKMHKVSKPGYPCRICGRCFNQSGHLAIHMRMHTGERPYPCDLCPKAFKVKVERDDHRRTHTGERPFACSACPKTFTAAARLREHARIHTDQRPYRCDICGAAFRRPYARTVHTLIHTGEKPHECDVCGTAFRRSGDMWKHKRTLHGVQAVSN